MGQIAKSFVLSEADLTTLDQLVRIRNGTCVVLLAYDLDTGKRYTQVRQHRTKADYAEFMHQVISA